MNGSIKICRLSDYDKNHTEPTEIGDDPTILYIRFSVAGKTFDVRQVNDGDLQVNCPSGHVIVIPQASNTVVLENKRY